MNQKPLNSDALRSATSIASGIRKYNLDDDGQGPRRSVKETLALLNAGIDISVIEERLNREFTKEEQLTLASFKICPPAVQSLLDLGLPGNGNTPLSRDAAQSRFALGPPGNGKIAPRMSAQVPEHTGRGLTMKFTSLESSQPPIVFHPCPPVSPKITVADSKILDDSQNYPSSPCP